MFMLLKYHDYECRFLFLLTLLILSLAMLYYAVEYVYHVIHCSGSVVPISHAENKQKSHVSLSPGRGRVGTYNRRVCVGGGGRLAGVYVHGNQELLTPQSHQ